jgi:threonyl-tRNA synthetase
MIHRAPFGSMERFVAILLEHTGGNFPLWLMPQQVTILTISEKYEKYAQKVLSLLKNNEIRAKFDNRGETMGKKIREAELEKFPFMLIIGEKEYENQSVTLRKHGGEDLGLMSIDEIVNWINNEIQKSISN